MMRQTRVGLFTIDEDDGRSVWRRGLGEAHLEERGLESSDEVADERVENGAKCARELEHEGPDLSTWSWPFGRCNCP